MLLILFVSLYTLSLSLYLFSYCLSGELALVCDDQEEEVVQVKAQQVLDGEDGMQFICQSLRLFGSKIDSVAVSLFVQHI